MAAFSSSVAGERLRSGPEAVSRGINSNAVECVLRWRDKVPSPNRRSRGAQLNRSGSQETAVYDLPLAVITE